MFGRVVEDNWFLNALALGGWRCEVRTSSGQQRHIRGQIEMDDFADIDSTDTRQNALLSQKTVVEKLFCIGPEGMKEIKEKQRKTKKNREEKDA